MMDCKEFVQFSGCYLDGEIDAKDRATFDGHVAACTPCRAHVDNQIAFRRGLRSHLKRPDVLPPDRRARIRREVAALGQPSALVVWFRRLAIPVPVLAALGLFVVVVPNTGFVVREAAMQHQEPMPVEVPSAAEDELDAWFRGKLPFDIRTPRFADSRVRLMGGRLTHIIAGEDGRHRKAAYLVYGAGPHKVTVLVFDASDLDLPRQGTESRMIDGQELSIVPQNGLNVALYRRGSLAYAITSDLAAPEMADLVATAY